MKDKRKSTNSLNINFQRESIQEEFVRYIFCFLGALGIYLVFALLMVKFYHPDIQSLINKGLEISIVTDFHPEPLEAMLYRMGLLVIPISLILLYWLSLKPFFTKYLNSKVLVYTLTCISFAAIVFVGIYVFMQPNPTYAELIGRTHNEHDRVADTNYVFFFMNLILQNQIWYYTLLYVPLLLLFYVLVLKRIQGKILKGYQILVSCLGYFLAFFILLSLIEINCFDIPVNWQNQYDFNAIYYSMTQVYAGSQLLVDNFTNTYGLYPHFLLPIFSIIGLNVSNFTLIMSLLIGFCFISGLVFLRVFTKDKLLLFLGFASTVLIPYLQIRLVTEPDSVFAMFPIRMFPISLLLLNISLLFIAKKYNKKIAYTIIYYLTMLLLSFGILWNFEFGTVGFIAWLLFLSYFDFYNQNMKVNWKVLLKHWGIGILSILFAFGFYTLIQYLYYGHYPNYRLLLSTLTVFGKYGFYMIPITIWHPWLLIVTVYIIGLIYAIAKLIRKQISFKSAVIFLVSILGCGIFGYYQGRSHNINFTITVFFFFIDLVLLTDELWTLYKQSASKILIPFLYLALYALLFSTIDLIDNIDKISDLSHQNIENKQYKATAKVEKTKIKTIQSFIDSCELTTPQILLLTSHKYQSLYMDKPRMRSAVNPGLLDMFYKADLKRYVDVVIDSNFNIFLDPKGFYYKTCEDIKAAVSQHYSPVKFRMDSNYVSCAFLKKQNVRLPEMSFFNLSDETIYCEKYKNDSLGSQRRIELSNYGIDSLQFPSQFSLEILVYPDSQQVYNAATVIGNYTDSTGFAIMKTINSLNDDKYSILLGLKGFTISLTPNIWHYLVILVDNDRVIVSDNNRIVANVLFPDSYKDSQATNLYIGNYVSGRYFFGLISEVSIEKGLISPKQMYDSWEKINKNLIQ